MKMIRKHIPLSFAAVATPLALLQRNMLRRPTWCGSETGAAGDTSSAGATTSQVTDGDGRQCRPVGGGGAIGTGGAGQPGVRARHHLNWRSPVSGGTTGAGGVAGKGGPLRAAGTRQRRYPNSAPPLVARQRRGGVPQIRPIGIGADHHAARPGWLFNKGDASGADGASSRILPGAGEPSARLVRRGPFSNAR